MKKLITIFLVIVLSVACFVACDGNENNLLNSSSENSGSQGSSLASSAQSSQLSSNASSVAASFSATSNTPASNSNESTSAVAPSPLPVTGLTYAQKIDAYIEKAYVTDTAFIDYIKALGEYEDNEEISQNAIFASPDGNGNGTLNSPMELQDALDTVTKGQTLYLRGGTYNPNNQDGYFVNTTGEANSYIKIRNYPNETPKITNSFVGSEVYGLQIDTGCAYTIIEGLEIANLSSKCAYGIVAWGDGQNHLIIRNNNIHDIKTNSANPESDSDAGANAILLFGEKSKPISNTFIAYNRCSDNVTGWSEALSITANAEYCYVVGNIVENNTNIGIDFYGNAGYCSTASLDQPRFSIAAANIITNSYCSYADCAGLYVDGARDILLHYNKITNCQYGIEVGSEEKQVSYPVKNIVVKNNLVVDNSVVGIRVGGYETDTTGVVYSTKIYNNSLINNNKKADEPQILFAKVDGIDIRNNLIYNDKQIDLIVYSSDFNESYTKNLTFKNNLIYFTNTTAANLEFNMYQKSQQGLNAFNTLLNASDIFGAVTLNSDYSLLSGAAINAADGVEVGQYDFNLAPRKVGELDIGAFEKQS